MIEINIETLLQCIVYGGTFLVALTYILILILVTAVVSKNLK